MRHSIAAGMLGICLVVGLVVPSGSVLAQTAGSPPDAPGATPPDTTPPAPAKPVRQTPRQRFEAANITHDGHLTRAQAAQAGMKALVGHFDAVDKDHKGYVTLEDMRSYAVARRQARAAAKAGNKT